MSRDAASMRRFIEVEAPVVEDLIGLELRVDHIQDLYQKRYDYRAAVPALLGVARTNRGP